MTTERFVKCLAMTLAVLAVALLSYRSGRMVAVPPPAAEVPPSGIHPHYFYVYPADLNHMNTLFGGKMLAEMDRCAGVVVRRFLHRRTERMDPVTVAVEQVTFHVPVKQKDLVTIEGAIKEVGKKSIKVKLEVWREAPGVRELAADGTFVFVTVDVNTRKAVEHGMTPE